MHVKDNKVNDKGICLFYNNPLTAVAEIEEWDIAMDIAIGAKGDEWTESQKFKFMETTFKGKADLLWKGLTKTIGY